MTGGDDWVPRISVPMVTFQHERFVGEAIESVLAQDCPDWEIIVGDDASSDRTIEIVQSYLPAGEWQGRQRIRILPWETKVGRRANYMRVLRACRGTYTAQLDGDDFLVTEHSLSVRADFLDRNPDFAWVFSAWLETDEHGAQEGPVRRMQDGRRRFTYADFGKYCLCTSSAVMARRGLYGEFPHWYAAAPVGDWPLHVINALHGDVGFLDEVLAIHRNRPGGVWSAESEFGQLRFTLAVQTNFVRDLPPEARERMADEIVPFNYDLGERYEAQRKFRLAHEVFRWCLRHGQGRIPRGQCWRRVLRNRLWMHTRSGGRAAQAPANP